VADLGRVSSRRTGRSAEFDGFLRTRRHAQSARVAVRSSQRERLLIAVHEGFDAPDERERRALFAAQGGELEHLVWAHAHAVALRLAAVAVDQRDEASRLLVFALAFPRARVGRGLVWHGSACFFRQNGFDALDRFVEHLANALLPLAGEPAVAGGALERLEQSGGAAQ
jgi:hypothetical protein